MASLNPIEEIKQINLFQFHITRYVQLNLIMEMCYFIPLGKMIMPIGHTAHGCKEKKSNCFIFVLMIIFVGVLGLQCLKSRLSFYY